MKKIVRKALIRINLSDTLGGEANAADHASDRGYWISSALTEMLKGKSALDLKDDDRLPTFAVTDCKSLYDALQKENPQVEDKRTLIDLLRLARTMSSDAVRWVPTEYMWADGLTKRDKHLRRRFLEWLGNIIIRLKERESTGTLCPRTKLQSSVFRWPSTCRVWGVQELADQ